MTLKIRQIPCRIIFPLESRRYLVYYLSDDINELCRISGISESDIKKGVYQFKRLGNFENEDLFPFVFSERLSGIVNHKIPGIHTYESRSKFISSRDADKYIRKAVADYVVDYRKFLDEELKGIEEEFDFTNESFSGLSRDSLELRLRNLAGNIAEAKTEGNDDKISTLRMNAIYSSLDTHFTRDVRLLLDYAENPDSDNIVNTLITRILMLSEERYEEAEAVSDELKRILKNRNPEKKKFFGQALIYRNNNNNNNNNGCTVFLVSDRIEDLAKISNYSYEVTFKALFDGKRKSLRKIIEELHPFAMSIESNDDIKSLTKLYRRRGAEVIIRGVNPGTREDMIRDYNDYADKYSNERRKKLGESLNKLDSLDLSERYDEYNDLKLRDALYNAILQLKIAHEDGSTDRISDLEVRLSYAAFGNSIFYAVKDLINMSNNSNFNKQVINKMIERVLFIRNGKTNEAEKILGKVKGILGEIK